MASQRGAVMKRGGILSRGRQAKITKNVLRIITTLSLSSFVHNFGKKICFVCVFIKQSDQNPRRNIHFSDCGLENAQFRRPQTTFVSRPQASTTSTVFTNWHRWCPCAPFHRPLPWPSKAGGRRGRVPSSSKVWRGRPKKPRNFILFQNCKNCFEWHIIQLCSRNALIKLHLDRWFPAYHTAPPPKSKVCDDTLGHWPVYSGLN